MITKQHLQALLIVTDYTDEHKHLCVIIVLFLTTEILNM